MKKLIALFDMDDTLCDTFGQKTVDLRRVSKDESEVIPNYRSRDCPPYVQERLRAIMSRPGWWQNLSKLEDGFQLYELAKQEGLEIEILTKAPKHYPLAWTEKFLWCKKNAPEAENITLTFKKERCYGDILIDDWDPYVSAWLEANPNGKAILPLREWNKDYVSERATHYDGKNLEQIRTIIKELKSMRE